jgi:hypothetical protein
MHRSHCVRASSTSAGWWRCRRRAHHRLGWSSGWRPTNTRRWPTCSANSGCLGRPSIWWNCHGWPQSASQLGKQVLAALLGGWFDALVSDCTARGVGDDILPWLDWRHAANPQLLENSLIARAVAARQRYAQDGHLRMPPLIACEHDLLVVPQPATTGHFHGSGCVEGALVQVGPASRPHDVPLRAVLAIESADPGYEWIFSREPVALVTAFGGPHSHMALRCAGAGCGAVLGVGIARFERLLAAPWVRIDFAAGSLEARATEQLPRQQVA